ncbi:LuxR C-terminal-related transcriptional regulator [Streptomyces sp. NPDC048723]|uniref:helix-turn-helix transcriptional regulator n=1 Tax=Streptomyces sp. NPDC048723 TaxID=3365589 RepID=UPI0037175ABE
MLETLGLDDLSERTYQLMLADPGINVEGIARLTGASPTKVREAMDRLAALSLLRVPVNGDSPVRPVSPEYGLEALLAQQQAELMERQHQMERSRAAAAALIAKFAHLHRPATDPYIEHLDGVEAVRERLTKLTENVRDELLAFAPGRAQSKENLNAARPLDERLLGRGVRMRTLYVDSVRSHAPSVAYATWLDAHGGQTRTVATLPLRMIIADREFALVPANPERSEEGAVLLHEPGIVAALCALFEHLWATGMPLLDSLPADGEQFGRQELEILRLLALGLTDEAVALRLGVSVRTTRRITAKVMERLGVRSRFQAGLRAAELGLLRSF